MKVAIMQPYFLPYIGYFQLINAVDRFVVYDNIQYTKKGWINRNRILQNGKDVFITLPLAQGSDFLNISQRQLAGNFKSLMEKQARVVREAYRKSPFFEEGFELYQQIIQFDSANLFEWLHHSLQKVCAWLDISTKIIVSSSLEVPDDLKGAERVLATCKVLQADTYINPIGGTNLYDKQEFAESGISLCFLQSENIEYQQFEGDFVPWLSILDIIMFNSKEKIKGYLNSYKLL